MNYCLYVSCHRTGYFYVGKGKTHLVLSGRYRGSGRLFLEMLKRYPKNEWDAQIVKSDLTEQEAYDLERFYIDRDLLRDPQCLNLRAGGRTAAFYSEESRARISRKAKARGPIKPEARAKQRAALLGRMTNPNSPAIAKAMGLANKGLKRSEEVKRAKSLASTGKKRGPYKVKAERSQAQLDGYKQMALKRTGEVRGPYSKKARNLATPS